MTKTKDTIPIREDAKARNRRWILAVSGLAVYCLNTFVSSRLVSSRLGEGEGGILKLKPNFSSLSFARELDDVTGNGSRNDTHATDGIGTQVVPPIATIRPRRVFELPYEEQKGSWTGNHWVPPHGWWYFSNQELLIVYKDKSIMWVGDSLARRAAATMNGILKEAANSSNVSENVRVDAIDAPKVVNANRQGISEPCTKWTWRCW
jgi:hypothetical protein